MKTFLDSWKCVATELLAQALAGEPILKESNEAWRNEETVGFSVSLEGDIEGDFTVLVPASALEVPLMGEGVEQEAGWMELLREVTDAAVGKLHAENAKDVRTHNLISGVPKSPVTAIFSLSDSLRTWQIGVADQTHDSLTDFAKAPDVLNETGANREARLDSAPGANLLVDVELEAALRFGYREMTLNEVLDLGPGDVIELDRQIADPVDLIVADKIVARGEVVLVNGCFGLRVTELAEPRNRLETIRCLF